MFAKKIKKLLLTAVSCILVSMPVLAAEVPEYYQTTERAESSHIQISDSYLRNDDVAGESRKVTLLPSVSRVEPGCFANNLYVEEIVWSASANSIPYFAFYACPKLKKVTISDHIKELDDGAFESDSDLITVKLSKNLKKIGDGVFKECRSLRELSIPGSLTEIGRNAFANCRSLKELYIPESVTEIGMNAFLDCDSLTVYGKKNSYAYYYCKMNGIPFVSQGTASKPAIDRPYIKSAKSKLVNKEICSTIALNGKVKDADGYQYQICSYWEHEVLLNKNSKNTSHTFRKVPNDVVYARVRAYEIKNGKKIYSQWSNEMRLFFPTIKKDNIKLMKAVGGKGTVTAQFSNRKYSDGFDCVLKNAITGETSILKNQKKNKITFKKVKPGTYYLKAHAYTRVNGIKEFGLWSDWGLEPQKIIVK